MAIIPPILCLFHYALLPQAGRVGLLGLGTTAWLLAALVLLVRTDRCTRDAAAQNDPSRSGSPVLLHAA